MSVCYLYFRGNKTTGISWLAANAECQRRGGYLASLNTQCEKETVKRALVRIIKIQRPLLIGLRSSSSTLPVYKRMVQWADDTVAFYVHAAWYVGYCGITSLLSFPKIKTVPCGKTSENADYLCEIGGSLSVGPHRRWSPTGSSAPRSYGGDPSRVIKLPVPRNRTLPVPSVQCLPGGHLTHAFLACDSRSACWWSQRRSRYGLADAVNSESGRVWMGGGVPSVTSCPAPMTSLPAMFACGGGGSGSGGTVVPYSLVCDHREQCADGSDENFCDFPRCSGSTPVQCASSTQCIKLSALCDINPDCLHGQDEDHCHEKSYAYYVGTGYPPPGVIRYQSKKLEPFSHDPVDASNPLGLCPETHFKCPPEGYCLPVFVVCNGVNDCPGKEDEIGCESDGQIFSCPSLYRCRGSRVCLHPSHMCDGTIHCPEQDDELFCGLACPAGCTCHARAFVCRHRRPSLPAEMEEVMLQSGVRYLDASGSSLEPGGLRGDASLLIHLGLSRCQLRGLHLLRPDNDLIFPNLLSLDLSFNQLRAFSSEYFEGMLKLRYLSLSRNPLKTVFVSAGSGDREQPVPPVSSLTSLDLSGVTMRSIDTAILSPFPGLMNLNLSLCEVELVTGEGLSSASEEFQALDIRGCPMTFFPRDLLSGLGRLETVLSDTYKLCCPDNLPEGFKLTNCRAPYDEISSCESLLRSDVYRVFIALFASFALFGNVGCFLVRNYVLKKSASGFGAFVSHLSVSDFLMGVYLAVIALADSLYKGSYLWEDVSWRHSAACKMAGFLSLLSNEVSAFFICLITLDRFLVLRFPFSTFHFRVRSANATCAAVWVVGLVMAAAPLTPLTSRWLFYSQTSICIPLPVTRRDFAGQGYAFGVMVVLNFVIFLLVAAGQVVIYASIRANSLSALDSAKTSTAADLRIARRLISVAVSDFLCWFPIGLLGLLASRGVPVPGEVNVAVAIMVLPLNSALNPFLYTLNVLLARRVKARDDQLLKLLKAKLDDEEMS